MKRIFVLLLLHAGVNFILRSQPSQSGLFAYYSFDSCNARDVSLNNSDGVIFGDPVCGCGVAGNSMYLDGVDDYAIISGNVEALFGRTRFTLSLYFRVDENSGTFDILSKRTNCNTNRAFSIRYTPASRTLLVELAEADNKKTTFSERLPAGSCWIHLVLVKDDISHRIYVNTELIASQAVAGPMDITSSAPIQIANSPCLTSTDRRFKGFIDEMRFYNRVLDLEEIRDLYLRPDRIVSKDTTVFKGGVARLQAGTSCADRISWSPVNLVDDTDQASTFGRPENTQDFVANYQYNNCTATDTVNVRVIDPTDISCGEVPLPNAFTPNGDGRNDLFFISNPFALEELKAFEVFDRLGNRVFATTVISEGWDGSYNGQEVNAGLYMYKLKYTCQGKERVKSGSIMLIR